MTACDLTKKHCVPCEGGIPALDMEAIEMRLKSMPDWQLNAEKNSIVRVFSFENFHDTMDFVNALAWISHKENHHPDLEVGYNRCQVLYMTHAVNGLTDNDFICAAKVDALLIV